MKRVGIVLLGIVGVLLVLYGVLAWRSRPVAHAAPSGIIAR